MKEELSGKPLILWFILYSLAVFISQVVLSCDYGWVRYPINIALSIYLGAKFAYYMTNKEKL